MTAPAGPVRRFFYPVRGPPRSRPWPVSRPSVARTAPEPGAHGRIADDGSPESRLETHKRRSAEGDSAGGACCKTVGLRNTARWPIGSDYARACRLTSGNVTSESPQTLVTELSCLVEDALDSAAVEVEFTGDGTLAVARLVALADGLLQGWRNRQFQWCILCQRWRGLVPKFGPGMIGLNVTPSPDEHHQQLEEPTSASAGRALTSAPTGPCPTPCARLAPTVATIPVPRLHAASRGTGWPRRLRPAPPWTPPRSARPR